MRAPVTSLLLPALLLASPSARAGDDDDAPRPAPVLLELFTSQGCSSCPAADQLLSVLGRAEETRARVVPLAFHVDYWNREGWLDPFGSAAWSARQERYARAFQLEGVYTPQLVIDGRAHQNGGEARRALAALDAEQARPAAAAVHIAWIATGPGPDGKPELRVEVSAELGGEVAAGRPELLVALFENGLVTTVRRGENRGKTLHDDYVVRSLATAFALAPRAGARGEQQVRIALRPAWKPENLGVAAFVQDAESMQVYGAAARMVR